MLLDDHDAHGHDDHEADHDGIKQLCWRLCEKLCKNSWLSRFHDDAEKKKDLKDLSKEEQTSAFLTINLFPHLSCPYATRYDRLVLLGQRFSEEPEALSC